MASRAQQKEEARQRRLAEERAAAERARRQRRLQMILGAVVVAVVVVVVAIVVSTGGSKKPANLTSHAANQVNTLLAGIPQSGNRLGSPNATVNVTEFGDLECPVCAAFSSGAGQTLIQKDVRSGKATLTYRSLCTATCNGPNQSLFATQQAAALAAGEQNRAWNYIELFYQQQGQEGTTYVNDAFLNGLARQIPGLDYSKWLSARNSSSLTSAVTADEQTAAGKGYNSTPTLVVQGPKGTAQPIVGDVSYSSLESAIKSVS